MSNIVNGSPQAILRGAQDLSKGNVPPVPEATPQHCILTPLLTQRGPTTATMVSGIGAEKLFGAPSFNLRSKFATHQTVLAKTVMQYSSVFVKRMVMPNAAHATFRLSLELVPYKVPLYKRYPNGSYMLDANGQKQPEDGAKTAAGYKAQWLLEPITDGVSKYGLGVKGAGTLAGTDGEASIIFPWIDGVVAHLGEYGNNVGFKLSAPTRLSSDPTNENFIQDQGAFLFRMGMAERADANSTPKTVESLNAERTVEFTLKPDTLNKAVDQPYGFEDIVMPSYQDLDTSKGTDPVYGPFGKLHLYDEFVKEALSMIHDAETKAGHDLNGDFWMVNPVSAVHYDGVPYYAVELAMDNTKSVKPGPNAVFYAKGGSDGDLTAENYDKAVKVFYDSFENQEEPLMDMLKYPFRAIWDSGFSLETKKSLLRPMGLRKDMFTVLSTQDVSQPINDQAEERSIATALVTAASMYPESTFYGTPVCRAIVLGHCAESKSNLPWKHKVPMTVDLAEKFAKYMGAGNGKFKQGESFDTAPKNQVDGMIGVQHAYKTTRSTVLDWDAGLTTVKNFDMKKMFYPGIQTVYNDDTSVLNSAINMTILCDLEMIAQRNWAKLTGGSKLTNEQFRERSDQMIIDDTDGRYDDRVVIVPETFYSYLDKARGYSWSCKIHMYANHMKTVGDYSVVIHRRSDLTA